MSRNHHPHGEGARVCEAQERNEQAVYELRGMAQQWQLDIPRILQILTGTDCQHKTTNG